MATRPSNSFHSDIRVFLHWFCLGCCPQSWAFAMGERRSLHDRNMASFHPFLDESTCFCSGAFAEPKISWTCFFVCDSLSSKSSFVDSDGGGSVAPLAVDPSVDLAV